MKYQDTESSILEFKREVPQNDQIIKTVIGFCNQNGGRLVIGVDNDGTIIGLLNDQILKLIEELNKTIFEATAPSIIPRIYTQTISDKTLLVIEVSSGGNKPYFRKSEGLEKGTYIRLGSTTLRATDDLIQELKWQSRGKTFDEMPVYQTSIDDLDLTKVEKFLQIRKERVPTISKEILFSYYLITQEHAHEYATTAGILLFGKKTQHFFSEAMIICSHFKGIEGRETIATVDCTGTLFEQYDTAIEFITSRLSKSFTIQQSQRTETLEIPFEAIREALLNLIIHRNYHMKSPAKIAIYQNRIEFFSPGTFAGPIDIHNLQSGFSFIRNIAICKVFREAKYIEKLGSGLITIFKSFEKYDLKTPSVIEGPGFVKFILPRGHKKMSKTEETDPLQTLFDTAGEITVSDVMNHLKVSRATAGRQLQALVKKKIIKKIGKGRSVRYLRR